MGLEAIGNRQNVLVHEVAYPSQGKDAALACPSGKQLVVHSMAAYNGYTATNNIGVGHFLATASWNFFRITAGAAVLDNSAQTGSAVNIFDTTANDGFYLQAKARFNVIYFNVSQSQSGSPVYEYTYWNGSAFVALPLIATPAYTSTGAVYVPFMPPVDWVVGSGGAISTTIQGSLGYVIRVRSTTAGGQSVIANSASVIKFFAYRGAISANQQLQVKFERPKILESGESMTVYYGTANASNLVNVCYQLEG